MGKLTKMFADRKDNRLDHGFAWLNSSPVRNSLLLIFLACLGFAIYFPAIQGPFLFDDRLNIVQSPAVRMTDFTFSALKNAAVGGFLKNRPVAYISFALNYLFGQYDVAGYHIVNILLHIATGFLLYRFLKVTLQIVNKGNDNFKSTFAIPAIAALVWFVHSIQSESVAYIVQRMNCLAALFYLLAMLLYVHGRLAEGKKQRVVLFMTAALSALLALGSKEISATLPVFIYLYEWYFFQDLNPDWLKKQLKYVMISAGAFLLIGLVFLGSKPVEYILGNYRYYEFSLIQHLLTELRVIVFYMSELLLPLPSRLGVVHEIPISSSLLTPVSTILSALLILFLVGYAIYSAKRERLISFSILWYLGNLLIESSVIPLDLCFEHRNYLPSMFFVLAIVYLFDRLIRREWVKISIVGLVMVLFSLATYQRSIVWGDEESFLRDTAEKAPHSSRVLTAYGNILSRKGKYDEAVAVYSQSLLNDPTDAAADLGLGNTRFLQGNYREAIINYRKALALADKDPEVLLPSLRGLALVYQNMGQLHRALHYYQEVLRFFPNSSHIEWEMENLNKKIRAKESPLAPSLFLPDESRT